MSYQVFDEDNPFVLEERLEDIFDDEKYLVESYHRSKGVTRISIDSRIDDLFLSSPFSPPNENESFNIFWLANQDFDERKYNSLMSHLGYCTAEIDLNLVARIIELNRMNYFEGDRSKWQKRPTTKGEEVGDKFRKFTQDRTMFSHLPEVVKIASFFYGGSLNPLIVYLGLLHDAFEDLPEHKEYSKRLNTLITNTKKALKEIGDNEIGRREIVEIANKHIRGLKEEYDVMRHYLLSRVLDYLQIPEGVGDNGKNLKNLLTLGMEVMTRNPFESYRTYIKRLMSVNHKELRPILIFLKLADRLHNTATDFDFSILNDYEERRLVGKPYSEREVKELLTDRVKGKRRIHFRNWIVLNESLEALNDNILTPEQKVRVYDMRNRLSQDMSDDMKEMYKKFGDRNKVGNLIKIFQDYSENGDLRDITYGEIKEMQNTLFIQAIQYDGSGERGGFQVRTKASETTPYDGFVFRMLKEADPDIETGYFETKKFDGFNTRADLSEFYMSMITYQALGRASMGKDFIGRITGSKRAMTKLEYLLPSESKVIV